MGAGEEEEVALNSTLFLETFFWIVFFSLLSFLSMVVFFFFLERAMEDIRGRRGDQMELWV